MQTSCNKHNSHSRWGNNRPAGGASHPGSNRVQLAASAAQVRGTHRPPMHTVGRQGAVEKCSPIVQVSLALVIFVAAGKGVDTAREIAIFCMASEAGRVVRQSRYCCRLQLWLANACSIAYLQPLKCMPCSRPLPHPLPHGLAGSSMLGSDNSSCAASSNEASKFR